MQVEDLFVVLEVRLFQEDGHVEHGVVRHYHWSAGLAVILFDIFPICSF